MIKQGFEASITDSGDILVTVTTINGNVTISNFAKVTQQEFCQQTMPIIRQLSPIYRDGITDVLPGLK